MELRVNAYPLGVRLDTAYQAIRTHLGRGDYLVFCSDGIIEATDAHQERFGFERTAEKVRKGCSEGLSADVLIGRLISPLRPALSRSLPLPHYEVYEFLVYG